MGFKKKQHSQRDLVHRDTRLLATGCADLPAFSQRAGVSHRATLPGPPGCAVLLSTLTSALQSALSPKCPWVTSELGAASFGQEQTHH